MNKEITYLDKALEEYGKSDTYPFHMPGHKRQSLGNFLPETIDITEVDGFDNLHHADGILAEAQDRMAEVFGADKSFFLVNGSTCGLLSAICASVPKGGKILIGRNCHKAVYHGIFLQRLQVEYVYPMQTEWGIQGSIDPMDVEKALRNHPDIKAVLITSPTYDGVVSDIQSISQIVHAHNIPLIVDEAHGAHFGFSKGFPEKALSLGADVVIESIHKTLPGFTQSAALHVKGERVNVKKLQKYLGIFQTSSPSYILMAGLDRCTRMLAEQGDQLMAEYEAKLQAFYECAKEFRHLQVFPLDVKDIGIFARDMSKILIFADSGNELAKTLLVKYGLQMEMESGHYVTALTSLMDTQEGFDRLLAALSELDGQYTDVAEKTDWSLLMDQLYLPKEKKMEIETAYECDSRTIAFAEAAGEMCCEFAYLYPPGIPFLVPGEVISENVVEITARLVAEGFEIQGLEDLGGERIKVAT